MNLGVFLYRGGSFRELKKEGHDNLLQYYIERYSNSFDKVYIFSYANEDRKLPRNCILIKNTHKIPLILYQFFMPIINRKQIRSCDVFRVFHISGTLPAMITKCLFRKKYVTTYGYLWLQTRNKENPGIKSKFENVFGKIIETFGLKKSEKVIVTVKTTSDYVKNYVSGNRIIKIPNSVDTKLFSPKKNRINNRIVFVGRFSKIKNLYGLIEAISSIESKPELVLVGQGEEEKKLEEHAKKMGVNMIIRGVVPRERVPDEINGSEVFILPSFSEGQPKVLLEAMSCGLPCIVSDIPSLREIVKDGYNGFLCGTDPSSIRKCLEKVLEDKKLQRKVGDNAREYIKNNFSAQPLIDKEIKLLKEIGKR
jgi:glycosyltransferase involved in cell wall biosynthesis